MKKMLLFLLLIPYIIGCENASPLDIYKDIGESQFNYPEWFEQGKYFYEDDPAIILVFEKTNFSYVLKNNSFSGPAKKVKLTILDATTFTLTIETNKSGVKFKIIDVDEPELMHKKIDVFKYFKEGDVETEFWGRFIKYDE